MISFLFVFLFWLSIALILFTYIGFPCLLALRAWLVPRSVKTSPHIPPVTMIVAAHNEADVITKKLDNVFQLEYPRDKLQVIIASDGSCDSTNDLVASYNAPEVELLALPRFGKNRTLNAAVSHATGDILVFSDADSMLVPKALRNLVAPFGDPTVGAVGGDYRYVRDEDPTGEPAYWSYDRLLKRLQSMAGSMTSATGQIYAIRRELFKPIPIGVTDDFFVSTQAPAAQRRLIFQEDAVAYGPIAGSAKAEFGRKVRVSTAGLTSVWRMRSLLNPLKHGFYSIQLFSHKVLRRLMVIPLLILFVSSLALWNHGWLYQGAAVFQIAFHTAGIVGMLIQHTPAGKMKFLKLPFFFHIVNAATILAIRNLLRGEQLDIWAPQRTSSVTAFAQEKRMQETEATLGKAYGK